jgi:hypothetical protein
MSNLRFSSCVGIFLCFLGVLTMTGSFFFLPLYSLPHVLGEKTWTAWEYIGEYHQNIQTQGKTFDFFQVVLFISLLLIIILFLLSLLFLITRKKILLKIFLRAWFVGGILLALLSLTFVVGFIPRIGCLVGDIGYALIFCTYVLFKQERNQQIANKES